jgi:hypothetical protein
MSVMRYVACRDCGRRCTILRCRSCNYAAVRATGQFVATPEVRMRRSPWHVDALGRWHIVEGLGPSEHT